MNAKEKRHEQWLYTRIRKLKQEKRRLEEQLNNCKEANLRLINKGKKLEKLIEVPKKSQDGK